MAAGLRFANSLTTRPSHKNAWYKKRPAGSPAAPRPVASSAIPGSPSDWRSAKDRRVYSQTHGVLLAISAASLRRSCAREELSDGATTCPEKARTGDKEIHGYK
jgi:hypothetical protein